MFGEASTESWEWPAGTRVSFSHDLPLSIIDPTVEAPPLEGGSLPDIDSGFDFSVSREISLLDELSSADDLFSDGKLLPLPIKSFSNQQRSTPDPPPLPPPLLLERPNRMSVAIEVGAEDEDDRTAGQRYRVFWPFCRSSNRQKAAMICPFPLSRSKPTGSAPNTHAKPTPKNSSSNNNKTTVSGLQKAPSDHWSTAKAYYYSGSKRGAHDNGVRISPVLNVPSPCFSRGNNGSGSSVLSNYLLCGCINKGRKRTAAPRSP